MGKRRGKREVEEKKRDGMWEQSSYPGSNHAIIRQENSHVQDYYYPRHYAALTLIHEYQGGENS